MKDAADLAESTEYGRMSEPEDELVLERRGSCRGRSGSTGRRPATRSLRRSWAGSAPQLLAAEADPAYPHVVLTGTGDRAFCAGHGSARVRGRVEQNEGGRADFQAFNRLILGGGPDPGDRCGQGDGCRRRPRAAARLRLIVIAEGARSGLPEVKRGLFPGGGGVFIGTRMPLAIALELTLTGDTIDAAPRRCARPGERGRSAPTRCSRWRWAMPSASPRTDRLRLAATKELVRLAVFDASAAKARRARDCSRSIWASEDAQEGADSVRRDGASRSGRGAERWCVLRSAASYGPPEAVEVGEIDLSGARRRARCGYASRPPAVNFPDVLIVADEYQITVPPPFVPGSELAGVVIEIADGVTTLAGR